MKAILIVDIEDTNLNECEISYVIQDRNGTVLGADTGEKLKPLPNKKEPYITSYSKGEIYAEDIGYNKAIDEILGDSEQ